MLWQNPEMKKGKFVNPHLGDSKRSLWDFVLWRLGYYDDPQPHLAAPAEFSYPAKTSSSNSSGGAARWIGHSTYLVCNEGLTFLTDPVFSSYCSPVPFPSLKRRYAPSIKLSELPLVDIVLLSHNHYDHMDKKTLCSLLRKNPRMLFIVPTGLKRWFARRGIFSAIELAWGETVRVSENCKITAVPAQHHSGRTLWDQNQTLWCGYVVECGAKKFYFAGDTGYNPVHFKEIGRAFSPIDLSLIPIGVYVPHKFMAPVHINPDRAVAIHQEVGSRLSLGMHWNTFALADEPPDSPPYDLYLAMKEQGVPFEQFLPVRPGEQIKW